MTWYGRANDELEAAKRVLVTFPFPRDIEGFISLNVNDSGSKLAEYVSLTWENMIKSGYSKDLGIGYREWFEKIRSEIISRGYVNNAIHRIVLFVEDRISDDDVMGYIRNFRIAMRKWWSGPVDWDHKVSA